MWSWRAMVYGGIALLGALTCGACKSDDASPSATAPGFVQLNEAVFKVHCAQQACHSGSRGIANLSFDDPKQAYARLIGGEPVNASAVSKGWALVTAGEPQASFLWAKLHNTPAQLNQDGLGGWMPLSATQAPGPKSLKAIEAWILAGAPYEGLSVDADVSSVDGGDYVRCEATSAEAMRECFTPADTSKARRVYTPPITVPPKSEVIICSYLEDIAEADILIKAVEGQQMLGGHHAAVFVAVAPVANREPHECTIEEMSNLRYTAGAGGAGGEQTSLPKGVSLQIDQGQQIVIQSHYINTSEQPKIVMDAVDLVYTTPQESPVRVDPFALLNDGFKIPPGAQGFERTTTCTLEHDYDLYMLLGHTHEYGTLFEVHHEREGGGERELLYRATDGKLLRESPDVQLYNEPLKLKQGDKLHMTCRWDNTTDHELGWPEEMCVGLMYYGPGRGWLTCNEDDGAPKSGGDGGEGCVPLNAGGNELGIGKACTNESRGAECRDNGKARLCLAQFSSSANFCTILGCKADDECGGGARCVEQQGTKVCLPLSCVPKEM